jgi:hypothetical protein
MILTDMAERHVIVYCLKAVIAKPQPTELGARGEGLCFRGEGLCLGARGEGLCLGARGFV